jgi:hypothetical protein
MEVSSSQPEPGFCRVLSALGNEPIYATAAADTDVWLVLEYTGTWASKAFERAEFEPRVRAQLDAWIRAIPRIRPQLIRRPCRVPQGDIALYLGISSQDQQVVMHRSLADYRDLLALDLPGLIEGLRRGQVPEAWVRLTQPLVLVCTHGRRDRCCAKWGQPVYQQVERRDDVVAWQTTHLGGHRFAATLLCLPVGLCYGRLAPDDVDVLLDATARREVFHLDRLRGRTCHALPAQAAEHFLREHTGERSISGVRIEGVETIGLANYRVSAGVQGMPYVIEVRRETTDALAPPSCGDDPRPIRRFVLLACTRA